MNDDNKLKATKHFLLAIGWEKLKVVLLDVTRHRLLVA
jgi:hypothetical protein